MTQSRAPSPSAACLDSQSVKTDGLRKHGIEYDGGKKIKGRKRHQRLETLGFLFVVVVTVDNVMDYGRVRTLLSLLNEKRQQFS